MPRAFLGATMKTSELSGAALDWAVAKSEGAQTIAPYSYSSNWLFGGPIIERERIRVDCPWNPGPFEATCKIDGATAWMEGDTVLTAAMRCYVVSKLGDEIDVPEELL